MARCRRYPFEDSARTHAHASQPKKERSFDAHARVGWGGAVLLKCELGAMSVCVVTVCHPLMEQAKTGLIILHIRDYVRVLVRFSLFIAVVRKVFYVNNPFE